MARTSIQAYKKQQSCYFESLIHCSDAYLRITCQNSTFFPTFQRKNMEFLEVFVFEVLPPPLGGHTRFRILFFLRYVVDIGKSSPNPKFFWNPMKTDQREAYQSSKFGLFSCFCTTSWKMAKIITYMVKTDDCVI